MRQQNSLFKKLLPFLFLLVCTLPAKAQDTLSSSQFFRLSYKFQPGIRTNDSSSIATSFAQIAPKMFADTKTFTEKALRDSGILNDVYYTLIYGALYNKDFDIALFYIHKARQLLYNKRYSIPPFMLEKAMAEAAAISNDSIAESKAFAQSIIKDFSLVDPAFVKDVANQSKGSFGLDVALNYDRDVNANIKEALKKDSIIVVYNMPYLMKLFLTKHLLIQKQPVLQSLLNQFAPEKIVMTEVQIKLRDGIKLGGLLFRDSADTGKVPVIISLSPYPSGGESAHGNIFAVNGYAFLYVDSRGRRTSEGEFFPYENDSQDYYDIIDWTSKQPWCSGKVATTGGSYLGFTQWQAIRKENRHPALQAINPMASVGFGIDFPRNLNGFNTYSLRWAAYVKGKEMDKALFENTAFWQQKSYAFYKNHVPFNKFDSVVGIKNNFFSKWLDHPDFDEYWQSILPNEKDYKALDIPVLTTTGYYDSDQNGALHYYRNHQRYRPVNKHYVILGPFDHNGSQWMPKPALPGGNLIDEEAQIPLYKLVIQWFDWALKGKALPPFFKNKVNYYSSSQHTWKAASNLQGITNDSLRLYLTSNGTTENSPKGYLSNEPPNVDAVFTYSHDIFSTIDSLIIFSPGSIKNVDSVYNAFNSGLVFMSSPLPKDLAFSGTISAHLYSCLNVKDADISILYTEMDSLGNETFLSNDKLRTRYRNSGSKPQLMIPYKKTLLHFNNSFVKVQTIRRGHKLKIYVLIENEKNLEKNYGFGGIVSRETARGPRKIELTIYSGKKGRSYFAIPTQ